MVLIDYLIACKTGFSDLVVTSNDDNAYGTRNYCLGQYIKIDNIIFNIENKNDLLQHFKENTDAYPEGFR